MTRRLALLAALLALGHGCALLTVQDVSRPSLDVQEGQRLDDEGWVMLVRARVAVAARNDRDAALFVGPGLMVPLPIVPLPVSALGTPAREDISFWIDVAIDPEGERFTLDPGEVRLSIGERIDLRPVRMRGLAAVRHVADRRRVSSFCGFDATGGPRAVDRIAVTQRSCVSLEFDLPPPPADVPFTVLVAGLRDGGQPVSAPAIRFTKGRRFRLESLP